MPVDIRYLERELDDIAIIVRLDNPRLTSVIAEFTETVLLFSQKLEWYLVQAFLSESYLLLYIVHFLVGHKS